MIYINQMDLTDIPIYGPYSQGSQTPNIQKMMLAIMELQQKLTEVSGLVDVLMTENMKLKADVAIFNKMRT